MKKQIAKSISILSLLMLLSGGAINVYASGGTCSVPSCRCPGGPRCTRQNVKATTTTPDATKTSEPDRYEQELALNEQPEDSFGFVYFLAQWAMRFLYLL
jgi:hypothetical protein